MPAASSDQNSPAKQNKDCDETLQPVILTELTKTRIAELAAGPYTPAQPHDLFAAFATEVWPVSCEERQ